ncbi:MAG: AbrB family transcriptional regulator [Alphaproteobacteria bacterium]|jgi:uncharacterized protein|nr:AbrB family transcriptional regulator [Rhodospirillaceae bacterium]MDG2480102.1 AbrB family transcriptional regulator [Alphaproteobacteria bacterium]
MKLDLQGFSWSRVGWAVVTLAIGTLGGVVFDFIGMPAAYLAGSMVMVALAAVVRVPVELPLPLRSLAFVVLGAILGATMDRRTLESLPEWPVSIIGLLVGLAILMTVVPRYLQRFHRIDQQTARMCAIPGALGYIVALSLELDVDSRRVAILHTLRLAVLLTFISAVVALAYDMQDVAIASDKAILDWWTALGLVAASFAVVPVAQKLRFPAPTFIAPMFLVGGLSMSGVIAGMLPTDLLWPSLVISGSVVGARFAGTSLRYLWDSTKAGLGGIALAIGLMGLLAWPVAWWTQMPFIQVWLAYAPGGFDAMPVLAFSLGLDPAFVAGHQLIRFLAISVTIPFLFRRPNAKPDAR